MWFRSRSLPFCSLGNFIDLAMSFQDLLSSMASDQPQFQTLPTDCTCNGERLILVWKQPRVGAMHQIRTYRCPECGHVETLEISDIAPRCRDEIIAR